MAAVDADWRDAEPLTGSFLEAGSFQLDAGTVELEFNDGARVTLRGPAAFELKNANHLHVLSGNLVAQIPEQALGFLVTTPQSAIINLGTEFGLVVDDAGQTDVHVIDGLVEVYEWRDLDKVTSLEAVQAGIKIQEGEARRLVIAPYDRGQPGFYNIDNEPRSKTVETAKAANAFICSSVRHPRDEAAIKALDDNYHKTIEHYQAIAHKRM